MVIVDLLGVPQADRGLIREWSSRLGRWRGTNTPDILADTHSAMTEFRSYVSDLVFTTRRSEPESDLVAALMGAGDGGRLDEDELAAFYVLLLLAGHETTTNLLGIVCWKCTGSRISGGHSVRSRRSSTTASTSS
ncbi:cytochrome P450 [Pseudonocardia sp. ICBG601]|uniref:cytochrome P450 n=1 Tax=Pseudonocardia sp. ICBG601 TaxID=2846759 RepID=UPI001CF65535|nr:cytochrome P450 [Pseudonocardia sp. ICBG601]